MKRFKYIILIFIFISSVLFFGCSQITKNEIPENAIDAASSGLNTTAQLTIEPQIKIGNEFKINTNIHYKYMGSADNRNRLASSFAELKNGNIVVVWISDWDNWSEHGVYGQIIDKNGKKVGCEFRVDTRTGYTDRVPEVAALNNGNFVVIWRSKQDDYCTLYGQVMCSDGTKIGTEFLVNEISETNNWFASVKGIPDGGFYVVWSGAGILGQLFDNYGNRIGKQTVLNDMGSGGGVTLTKLEIIENEMFAFWKSTQHCKSIFFRRITYKGIPVGDVIKVNKQYSYDIYQASIGVLGSDTILFTYRVPEGLLVNIWSITDGNKEMILTEPMYTHYKWDSRKTIPLDNGYFMNFAINEICVVAKKYDQNGCLVSKEIGLNNYINWNSMQKIGTDRYLVITPKTGVGGEDLYGRIVEIEI